MIELRTLGSLELTSAESSAVGSVLAQPRRAALLCYLALAAPRGFHRRDTLFALFWPEYDAEQARHALRQSVYFLRRALGPKTIVSRGDEELALAPEQVHCDVWHFDAALDQGRPAEALALYRGELLAGLPHLGRPGFRALAGGGAQSAEAAGGSGGLGAGGDAGAGRAMLPAQRRRRAVRPRSLPPTRLRFVVCSSCWSVWGTGRPSCVPMKTSPGGCKRSTSWSRPPRRGHWWRESALSPERVRRPH